MKTWNAKTELKRLLWLLPGPLFFALFRLSFLAPQFVEEVYARVIFPVLNRPLSALTGLLPFSLAEFLLYGSVVFVAVFLISTLVRAVMARRAWWQVVFRRVIALLGAASMIYALFVMLWGFNYARVPLADTLGLDASPATARELYATSETLIDRANTLRETAPENDDGIFTPEYTRADIMRSAFSYYDNAASKTGLSFLGGSRAPVKPVLYSTGLSYAHISGVYFPFTAEANVNTYAPMLLYASTCLHEIAHQRGFAREDEANFLAYYVSIFADDVSVRYSGTMLALVHAMNALHSADSDLYFELRENYSDGLVRDLRYNSDFWAQYESAVSEAATEVNNTFLKTNMQEDGVKSYGRMVDLLIGLWRQGNIAPFASP